MSFYEDNSKLRYELSREFGDNEFDDLSVPDLGSDWREKVYAGEVDVPSVGFAGDETHYLVGHGHVTDEFKCGQFKGFTGCLNLEAHAGMKLDGIDYTGKVYVKRHWNHCNKPECPICFKKGWAVREAKRMEKRLLYGYARGFGKIEHIIVSPPQNLGLEWSEMRKLVIKAMLERGIVGGVWVYHHFRYRNFKVSRRTGLKKGWYKAPHFHILGFIKSVKGLDCSIDKCRKCPFYNRDRGSCGAGVDVDCNGFAVVSMRAYEKDGVIAKVQDERKTIGGTAWYELNHASLRRDVKKNVVVNWFGICGRNKLKVPKGARPQKDNCKICGNPLKPVKYHNICSEFLRFCDTIGLRRSDGVVTPMEIDGKVQWSYKVVKKFG